MVTRSENFLTTSAGILRSLVTLISSVKLWSMRNAVTLEDSLRLMTLMT